MRLYFIPYAKTVQSRWLPATGLAVRAAVALILLTATGKIASANSRQYWTGYSGIATAALVDDSRQSQSLLSNVDVARDCEAVECGGDTTMLQRMLIDRDMRRFKLLLEAGADPSQIGLNGDTVVHLAAAIKDSRFLALLLAKGASPAVRNSKSGRTPLMIAIIAERTAQFDMLLKNGDGLDLVDHMGNSALHVAAQINEPQRVLALLEAGASPRLLNYQGYSFQRYLRMLDDNMLDPTTLQYQRAVDKWLIEHGVPIEWSIKK